MGLWPTFDSEFGGPGGITNDQSNPAAVFVNVTVADTEGRGYLVVRASDLSGLQLLPPISNVNWSGDGQTVANLVITPVGENTLEVHGDAGGDAESVMRRPTCRPS